MRRVGFVRRSGRRATASRRPILKFRRRGLLCALLLGGLVLGGVGSSRAQIAGRPLSLEDAVELALERNETLRIAVEEEHRAAGAVKEAWAGALPNIALEGTYQGNFKKPAFFAPEEFGGGKFEIGEDVEVQGRLRVDQVLYAFGRVGNAVKFANIYQEISSRGVDRARSDVVYAAKEAYFRVLLMREVANIHRLSLRQAKAHLAQVEERHAKGTASRFELLRARVEVKNREPEVIGGENDLALSFQDLKRILGLDGEANPILTDALAYAAAEIEEKEAVTEALARRPEILSLELNVEGRERILAIERAGVLPTLGLYGQVTLQGQSDRNHLTGPFYEERRAVSTSAGIALTIPLFDGFRTRGKVQQARSSLRRAEYELEQAVKGVRLEVTKAVQDLESLRLEYESQQATVALAEEAYRIAETRFASGLSTQLELNDAETALDFARTNFAEMLYRYNVAVAHLERVLGRTSRVPVSREEE